MVLPGVLQYIPPPDAQLGVHRQSGTHLHQQLIRLFDAVASVGVAAIQFVNNVALTCVLIRGCG